MDTESPQLDHHREAGTRSVYARKVVNGKLPEKYLAPDSKAAHLIQDTGINTLGEIQK